jgi:hypothetical protein
MCCCPVGGASAGVGSITDVREAKQLLQQAWAEGDTFLTVNVPPSWSMGGAAKPFASTRMGVLWNCTQVEAAASSSSSTAASAAATAGRSSRDEARSWRTSDQDLFGRSLPSQGYSERQPVAGAFVAQDNTDKVMQGIDARGSAGSAGAAARPGVPQRFVIRPGTILSDSALQGDVEAVFSGRVSVCTQQTWPATHPFQLNDQLMVHALAEDDLGMPAWLSQ